MRRAPEIQLIRHALLCGNVICRTAGFVALQTTAYNTKQVPVDDGAGVWQNRRSGSIAVFPGRMI